MEISGNIPPPLNLTGRVSVVDSNPKFAGKHSAVYLGSFNGNSVAIKVIKITGEVDSVRKELLREITLWGVTNHRNIHTFYGLADDEEFGPFGALISPWYSNGDVTRYLEQNGDRMIMAERINLWKGVIEGVAYLHQHNPTIIHGDLKPRNILVDDLCTPRICDFGLARVYLEAESTGMTTTCENTGETRYLAPELLANEGAVHLNTASDVYSLGCLGLEFIYNQKPYSNYTNDNRAEIVHDIKCGVSPATSPPHQSWASKHVWPLIEQLWSPDPRSRPSASNAVFVLNHTARSLPPIVIQRVVLFSAMVNNVEHWVERWIQRTHSLLALSLVSKSFCAYATPFLYRDIRLIHQRTTPSLSRLAYTLENSTKHTHSFDHSPNGYGSHTRTFLICVDKDIHTLSGDIQTTLRKMPMLQTFEIRVSVALPGTIPVHFLSTARLSGDGVALILDQGMAQALSHFQRLVVVPDHRLCSPMPDLSQITHKTLLPNLQDIDLWEGPKPPELLPLFTDWVMPRLKSLTFVYYSFSLERRRAFMGLLLTQGELLWYLKMEFKCSDALPMTAILEMCSSLRSLVVVACSSAHLHSLPPHSNLEALDIHERWERGGDFGEPYLHQFDVFTSSWRVRFPNLRMIRFKGVAFDFCGRYYCVHLEMVFRTEESVYTINDSEETYKRWQGSWIGAEPPDGREAGLPFSRPPIGRRILRPEGEVVRSLVVPVTTTRRSNRRGVSGTVD